MKHYIPILLALLAAVMLVACNTTSSGPTWSEKITIEAGGSDQLQHSDGTLVQITSDLKDGIDVIVLTENNAFADFNGNMVSGDRRNYKGIELEMWDPDGSGPERRVIKYRYITETWTPVQ